MIATTIEIKLHDNSLIHVSRTDTGAIWMEYLAPMMLSDGHGLAVKGSARLTEETVSTLRDLLTSPTKREAA